MSNKLNLEMDDLDYAAVIHAISKRMKFSLGPKGEPCLPDAECGNIEGRVIAEICRGWEEMLGVKHVKPAK